MISEKTYKENYWRSDLVGDIKYIAKPAKVCKTENLVREYFELESMWENGIGDEEVIEKRMNEIDKEMPLRNTGRLVWKMGG